MPLTLTSAVPPDVPTLVNIYFAAFQNPHSLRAFPRIPTVRKWWEDMLYEEIQDPNACFLKIVDDDKDGEIVAYAKWNRPKVDGEDAHEDDEGLPESWPEGGDEELCVEFFGQLARKKMGIMGRKRFWYLEQVATLPEYQGRGCGSRLMKWALDQADEKGTEAYLEASAEGLSLYRKLGFVDVDKVVVDIKGSGEYSNVCMVREARKREG